VRRSKVAHPVGMRALPFFEDRSQEEIEILMSWYEVRDFLIGLNVVEHDVERARVLAASCRHPDAVWLTSLFAGRPVSDISEARRIFEQVAERDPRALCFAAALSWPMDVARIRRAAEMGYAYAQGDFFFFFFSGAL
jgi:hypothetical protein